jgi:hypothetical protein
MMSNREIVIWAPVGSLKSIKLSRYFPMAQFSKWWEAGDQRAVFEQAFECLKGEQHILARHGLAIGDAKLNVRGG